MPNKRAFDTHNKLLICYELKYARYTKAKAVELGITENLKLGFVMKIEGMTRTTFFSHAKTVEMSICNLKNKMALMES